MTIKWFVLWQLALRQTKAHNHFITHYVGRHVWVPVQALAVVPGMLDMETDKCHNDLSASTKPISCRADYRCFFPVVVGCLRNVVSFERKANSMLKYLLVLRNEATILVCDIKK